MALLIDASGASVAFGKEEIPRIPYLTDILPEDYATATEPTTVPIVCTASHKGMEIVKQMLEMQTRVGKPFKYEPAVRTKYGVEIKCPAYMTEADPWAGTIPEYADQIASYSIDDIVELFVAADGLCCYDLRYAAAYVLIPYIRNYEPGHEAILARLSPNCKKRLNDIHLENMC